MTTHADDTTEEGRGREWYRTLVERSTDIVSAIGADGDLQYKNAAVEESLGYDSEDLIGENTIELVHPDDREAVTAAITPVIEGERRRSEPYEYRFRHADGRWVWFESVLTDCRDTPVGNLVVNSREVTDRKRRERELRRERDRLDEFASLVSHDLRNPLNVAEGHLELARDGVEGSLDEVARAHDRMRALIDDLLTLARDGRSVEVSEMEPVALGERAEACWRSVEPDGDDNDNDHELVVDADGTVVADPARLRRLLENLLRNSVEHGSTDGRPAAGDGADHGEQGVTVTVGDLDDGFYVADDGPGIPPDERGEVFERGYSTSESGTGFGLTIVEEIAEAHGWSVDVTGSEAGGARLEVTGVDVEA
ncbi:MAG: PAS domain-containing sensor histidine kinase [Haloferacaceae archaeon]